MIELVIVERFDLAEGSTVRDLCVPGLGSGFLNFGIWARESILYCF